MDERKKAAKLQPPLRYAEPVPHDPEFQQDDLDWAKRCELWGGRSKRKGLRRAKREKPRQPLILTGHGLSLRIENGALTIREGFTHFPQNQEVIRFFKGEPSIPERIIVLDGSGNVTFDVLSWLSEQAVDLILIDWCGDVVCVASRCGYAANPYRVEWQRETRADEFKRMEFSVEKITQKIENSISTLEKSVRKSDAWNKAMEIAYSSLTKLDAREPRDIVELRALEANAAAAYFRAWRGTPIKWRGISRRPVPESWKEIGQRTSIFHKAGNRNASHPINVILNYAYTVLQSHLQIGAIANGYAPTIGIMHEGNNGSAAFVFDLMEPYRPAVDRKILEFVRSHVFDPADFVIRADGGAGLIPRWRVIFQCWLKPTYRERGITMFRILCLDGGGIKGVFTAAALARIEDQTNKRIIDHFDLICGTSTGGILAIGLGMGLSAQELLDFYRQRGPIIFPATSLVERSRGFFRQLFLGPKLSHETLRRELQAVLGDRKFGNSKCRLVIPSYDAVGGRIYAFKTAHHERFLNDIDTSAVEVALATSAAPTYFAAASAQKDGKFVDGGVWANCPVMVGIVEAVAFLKIPLEDIHILSIGTTASPFSIEKNVDASALKWNVGLVNLMFEAQAETALAQANLLLGSRLHRLNYTATEGRFSLDNATDEAIGAMSNLGRKEAEKKVHYDVIRSIFMNGDTVKSFQPLLEAT